MWKSPQTILTDSAALRSFSASFSSQFCLPAWFSLSVSALIKPPYTTCSAANSRETQSESSWWKIMEHLAAKETDVSLRGWWRPKTELKKRERISDLHSSGDTTTLYCSLTQRFSVLFQPRAPHKIENMPHVCTFFYVSICYTFVLVMRNNTREMH